MNQYFFELGKFFVGKKTIRTTELAKKVFERELKKYDDDNIQFCSKLIKNIKIFNPVIILEIGCGNGRNLRCIENEYKCYGIEITDYGYKKAVENCKHSKIQQASAEYLPFEDNSMDLIFTVHALEQMPLILDNVIKEMHRVCKIGVLLFEPIYEKQGFWGKLHNYNLNYARNIEKTLIKNNFRLLSLEEGNYSKTKFNRTWIIKSIKVKNET